MGWACRAAWPGRGQERQRESTRWSLSASYLGIRTVGRDRTLTGKCGRPTKSGKPCQNNIYGAAYRACGQHETPEDVAWREGYFAGATEAREQAARDREFWIAEGRRQQRSEADRRRAEAEREKNFKTTTSRGEQIVQVDRYAYRWGGEPLKVGDRVLLPANWLSEVKHGKGPFPGTVTAIGSSYDGDMSAIIRKISSVEGQA